MAASVNTMANQDQDRPAGAMRKLVVWIMTNSAPAFPMYNPPGQERDGAITHKPDEADQNDTGKDVGRAEEVRCVENDDSQSAVAAEQSEATRMVSAVPMETRSPVMICGSAEGSTTNRKFCQRRDIDWAARNAWTAHEREPACEFTIMMKKTDRKISRIFHISPMPNQE